MRIERITEVSEELVEAGRRLLPQLNPTLVAPDRAQLAGIVAAPTTSIFAARDAEGGIVGLVTLVVARVPSGVHARIEDLVVDEAMRGRGAGAALCRAAIARAAFLGAAVIELNSNPSRLAAHRLYRRLGFEQRETDCFHFDVKR